MDLNKLFLPNTFRDARNNMVYYDRFNDHLYKIPKEVESLVKLFLGRALYSAILFLFLHDSGFDPLINIVAALGLFGLSSLYFNMALLPKYHPANNFDLKQAWLEISKKGKQLRLVMTVLYVAAIGIVIYMVLTEESSTFLVAGILFAIYSVYKIIQNVLLLKQ